MSARSWVLTDCAARTFSGDLVLARGELAGAARDLSVRKQTLRGGLQDGVDTVEIDNGTLKFVVLPTRGMGIWKAWLGDAHVGWNSPVKGPVHPGFVPVGEPSGLGWLDGFDELLCRCGLLSNGAPDFDSKGILTHPLHGRVANLPAERVELTVDEANGEVTLRGIVDECRFHFQKLRLTSTIATKAGEPGVRIIDEITNLSGFRGETQLLYHINFGQPLALPGSEVVAPVKAMAPRDPKSAKGIREWHRYGEPQPGAVEDVYFFQLLAGPDGRTRTLLKNAAGNLGMSLVFNVRQLPCFSLWKNTPAMQDGYVTGLEPGTNYPNTRSYESKQGRVVALEPGQTARFELVMEVHPDAASVQQAEAAVRKIQGSAQPTVFDQPQAGWSA